MMITTKISRENYFEGNPGSSNSEAEAKGWTTLWKTTVPFKVRVFLWRLAQQSLPTANLLNHRHMATTSVCSLCGTQDSWRHSLLECDMVRSVWALLDGSMVEHMEEMTGLNAKNWLFGLMGSLSHDQFTVMVVSLWAIWTPRRKAIHEDIFQSPISTHGFIMSYIKEICQLAKPSSVSTWAKRNREAKWIPSERSYRAPCVVLVINDNPYGLMVALSYMCRTCP
jgi:hypothetical protein